MHKELDKYKTGQKISVTIALHRLDGQCHYNLGYNCQDYSFEYKDDDKIILIVADGVGGIPSFEKYKSHLWKIRLYKGLIISIVITNLFLIFLLLNYANT